MRVLLTSAFLDARRKRFIDDANNLGPKQVDPLQSSFSKRLGIEMRGLLAGVEHEDVYV